MNYKNLKTFDSEIYKLIKSEEKRQREGLEMIPSENYVSEEVLEAMGSILTNKYSEGYVNKRYYGGNEFIDQIEEIACARARKLFGVPYVNVQPYSGSPANQAVCFAVLKPGETLMGLNLHDGGHLTHGWKLSFSGTYYNSIPYHVKSDGKVDFDEVAKLVKKHKPRLVWIGGSAYTKKFEFRQFEQVLKDAGSDAYLVADVAHVAGLIAGGVYPDPAPFVDIITTTTHKTLRGPRGGMIMVTARGLKKDPALPDKIDKAIIPGLQGGPHNHTTAAIAVALKEASSAKFTAYSKQIIENSQALARSLKAGGLDLVGGGTDCHLVLVDLVKTNGVGSGNFVEFALGIAGITVNKNVIPGDPSSPFYPSGFRCGTPALTSRKMKEREMQKIGMWISEIVHEVSAYKLPSLKEERVEYIKKFKRETAKNKKLLSVKREVEALCKKFPVPGISR